jgi:hypothetical protein
LAKAAPPKLDRAKAGSIGGTHSRKCGKIAVNSPPKALLPLGNLV